MILPNFLVDTYNQRPWYFFHTFLGKQHIKLEESRISISFHPYILWYFTSILQPLIIKVRTSLTDFLWNWSSVTNWLYELSPIVYRPKPDHMLKRLIKNWLRAVRSAHVQDSGKGRNWFKSYTQAHLNFTFFWLLEHLWLLKQIRNKAIQLRLALHIYPEPGNWD